MKKFLFVLLALVAFASVSFSSQFVDSDPQGVSIKAGPTDPIEALSIAWVEAALYPKNVEKGKELFLEVKLTSKVKRVFAEFNLDEKNKLVELYSDDGMSWSRVYKTPINIENGVFVSKVVIEGLSGRKITRTLDFAIIDSSSSIAQNISYPVSVIDSAVVVDGGQMLRQLLPGVRITALYKAPFYRVQLSDGKEGWIEAAKVKEPTEEFYLMGYKSYQARDYKNAQSFYQQVLAMDPFHVKARYWLAKTYMMMGNDEKAVYELKEVVKADPNFTAAKDLAFKIGQDYYNRGLSDLNSGKFSTASANFKRALDVMPNMVTGWIKLGDSYSRMGQYGEARLAWKEALKVDPENSDARILLGYKNFGRDVEVAKVITPKQDSTIAQTRASKDFVKDSIELVQGAKTSKGTSVSSAVKSVLALTRSLGTKIYEDGWKVSSTNKGFLVRYACRQERNGKVEAENFDWKLDPDNKKITALNENSKLLMTRW